MIQTISEPRLINFGARAGPARRRPESATAPVERLADPASLDWGSCWDRSWEQSIVEAALESVKRQVSAVQYEIFHLHVCREQSVKQTAAALQISPAMVYLAKHRVGRVLKREVLRIKKSFDWE